MAQFGRALGSGPRGRKFESSHSDHNSVHKRNLLNTSLFYSEKEKIRTSLGEAEHNRMLAKQARGAAANLLTPTINECSIEKSFEHFTFLFREREDSNFSRRSRTQSDACKASSRRSRESSHSDHEKSTYLGKCFFQ